ncbi:MAG: hypothetical protein ACLPGW_13660 [Roseiarcus sp.]
MSVSAISSVAGQAVLKYAPVAPVAKVKSVRRASAAKSAKPDNKRAPAVDPPAIGGSRSPAAEASSTVLAVLDKLQLGG